jgi:putative flippase GtrA
MINLIKKIFKFWFSLKQPIRFALVGGYNTVLGYIIFAGLTYLLQIYLWEWVVLLISYVIGILNNFVVFKIFVFQTKGKWLKELIKTYYSYIFVYILNAAFLYAFMKLLNLNAYLSQGICIIILPIITYFIMKHFTFKTKH